MDEAAWINRPLLRNEIDRGVIHYEFGRDVTRISDVDRLFARQWLEGFLDFGFVTFKANA